MDDYSTNSDADQVQDDAKPVGDGISRSSQIFDITPDLNIAPATDSDSTANSDASPAISINDIQVVNPVLKSTLESKLGTTIGAKKDTPAPIPVPVTKPAVPVTPPAPVNIPRPPTLVKNETRPSIPLQDINIPNQKPPTIQGKNRPSYPATKTIGYMGPNRVGMPSNSNDSSDMNVEKTVNSDNIIVPKPQDALKMTGDYSTIKPIRTYEGDIADIMTKKRTSAASIAIAETKKADGVESIATKEPSHAGRKIFFTLLSLILIGAGVIGAYLLYTMSPLYPANTATQNTTQNVTGVVPADSQVVLPIDNMSVSQIMNKLQSEIAKPMVDGAVKEIIPVKTVSGNAVRITAPEALNISGIEVPDMLSRSLGSAWMIGVHNEYGSKSVFVVITNNFFQNAFAGMLQWESVMADDLKLFLQPSSIAGIANVMAGGNSTSTKNAVSYIDLNSILPLAATGSPATSTKTSNIASSSTNKTTTAKTSTSTPVTKTTSATSTSTSTPQEKVTPLPTLKGHFEDHIVKNKDVREFITSDGHLLFLYAFVDNNRLVITSSESALSEVVERLEKQSYIR